MKRISILSLLTLSAALTLHAETRTLAEAQEIARQFLSSRSGQPVEMSTMRRAARSAAADGTEAEAQPYYAFNDVRSGTFVVVSATTLTRPVLAYGTGLMPADIDGTDLPDGLRWWLGAIAGRTAWLEQHPDHAENPAQRQALTQPVEPLMNGIAWDQDAPYNLQTPTISNLHCPTGCAATAMAQIMRHHQHPATGQGNNSYRWQYTQGGTRQNKTLSVDFSEQTYDYSLMPLVIDARHPASSDEKDEVAKLMYHCGVALNMQYALDGSGTSPYYFDRALVDFFGYNSLTTCLERDCYSYDEWVDIMQSELREGRPVLYGGNSAVDEGGGHAFILEGFDADGLFYINWGWSGNYNAYYDIAVLNPSGVGTGAHMMADGFCEGQNAVVNVTPTEGAGTYRTALAGDGPNTLTAGSSSTSTGAKVTISARSIYNFSGRKAEGDYGLVLMQGSTVIDRQRFRSVSLKGVSSNGGIEGFNISSTYTIPSSLANGVYQAYLYFQPSGSEQWDFIRMRRNTYESYLQLEVSDSAVTITRPSLERKISASAWSFDSQSLATRIEQITASVTNQGDETLAGHFSLLLTAPSGTTYTIDDASTCLNLAPGQSNNVSFTHRFTEAGDWTSVLYFKPWNVGATSATVIDETRRTFNVEADYLAGAVLTLNAAPDITSGSDDGKFYRNSPAHAEFDVTNTGCDYNGTFAIWLYTKSTNPKGLTPVAKYEGTAVVAADGKPHQLGIDFTLDLSSLTKNVSYFARPYYFDGTEWTLLSDNYYTKVNIYGKDDPSGIAEITVDQPAAGALLPGTEVFNVLGKPLTVPASGKLPRGIYIVSGRKMVVR